MKKLYFICSLILSATCAMATNGHKMIATGKRVGTAGAGVAQSMDVIDGMVNPSLIAHLDPQVMVALGLFHPERYFDSSRATTPPQTGAPQTGNPIGKTWARTNDFFDRAFGIRYGRAGNWKFSLSMACSGGMMTNYPHSRINPALLGVITNGNPTRTEFYDSGISYRIMNINLASSYEAIANKLYFGISPIIAHSVFRTNSATTTLKQTEGRRRANRSMGYGLRLGMHWHITPSLTYALTGQIPTFFANFQKYRDLLPGRMNFPPNFTTGIAWNFVSRLSLLLDYEYIWYRAIKVFKRQPAHSGFGWSNMHVIKTGLMYEFNEMWSGNVGYNYGKSPIKNNVVFANVLAPAVVEHHFAAGITFKPTQHHGFTLSGYYAPMHKQTEDGTGDACSHIGRGTKIGMRQWACQLNYNYYF
jgi:long-chain fatty acid transport protein